MKLWLMWTFCLLAIVGLVACGGGGEDTDTDKGTEGGDSGAVTTEESGDEAELTTVELAVDGMTCGACVGKVRKQLVGVQGVKDCEVSLTSKTAVCKVDKSVDPKALEKAVTGQFTAKVKN